METLTIKQAYLAMYLYLENLYKMTNSEDIGGFLSGMSFLQDGGTADAAAWDDWLKAVEVVLKNEDPELGMLTFKNT